MSKLKNYFDFSKPDEINKSCSKKVKKVAGKIKTETSENLWIDKLYL